MRDSSAFVFQSAGEGGVTFLQKGGEEVVGFVDVGLQRHEYLEVDGEINTLYVRKAFYGTGLGLPLMKKVAETLRDAERSAIMICWPGY